MKKISEHLGEIIVALAGVALLVAAVVVFKAPIGEFYNSMLSKETSIADTVLEGMDNIDLGDLTGGGAGGSGGEIEEGDTPEGGDTAVTKTEITLEEFGHEPVASEVFEYGDYNYTYGSDSWTVRATDKTKTEYGPLLTDIAGHAVTTMAFSFSGCTNMTVSPVIPGGIDGWSIFDGCTSLETIRLACNSALGTEDYHFGEQNATIEYVHIDGCDGSCGK